MSCEFERQKRHLGTKLIDLHTSFSSGFIRAPIADGMRALGAADVALVLSRGPNVAAEKLEVVRREQAAQAEARRELPRAR